MPGGGEEEGFKGEREKAIASISQKCVREGRRDRTGQGGRTGRRRQDGK